MRRGWFSLLGVRRHTRKQPNLPYSCNINSDIVDSGNGTRIRCNMEVVEKSATCKYRAGRTLQQVTHLTANQLTNLLGKRSARLKEEILRRTIRKNYECSTQYHSNSTSGRRCLNKWRRQTARQHGSHVVKTLATLIPCNLAITAPSANDLGKRENDCLIAGNSNLITAT
ncbi:uncharacterized protein BDR25DRAFT_351959 [Lindgomyces ingoldianus]|uniref:Uncharacterized protein n=1 Tax=Lindgomyces ingoldianus TaxID=673940 RepID=A0ACB6R585_9PLEO|nr:uncharacterized protein BDR25DRAFT_351959 [Lindgomyces ingoldianus]KAF2474419.1 hypothetical protein BDR25DRAFT_351959 [Lindgomyces ingoldianus]